MRILLLKLTRIFPSAWTFHVCLLFFRVVVSLELMFVHGLKKVGIGVPTPEQVPNPLHLPEIMNQGFAIASNLVFPLFVMIGLMTRLAIIPILAVTLSGYFLVHWNDSLLEKDMPFMYSISYLLLLCLGSGKYAIDYWINKSLTKNL
jgi:putative oxidoreductase